MAAVLGTMVMRARVAPPRRATQPRLTLRHTLVTKARVVRPARCNVFRPSIFAADAAASFGDEPESYEVVVFPRMKERDPWRRLGVAQDASTDELVAAKQYLLEQHRTHIEGCEAINQAYDKIIAKNLRDRAKAGKITTKKKDDKPPPAWQQQLKEKIDLPTQKTILQRAFVYAFIALWSLYQPASTGPAFQVACAFGLTIYFLYNKRKPQGGQYIFLKAIPASFGALFAGWLVGSILPVYLAFLFPPALSPEAICALFSYVTMWWVATYWK